MGERSGPSEDERQKQPASAESETVEAAGTVEEAESTEQKLRSKETVLELMTLFRNLSNPDRVKQVYYQRLLEICDLERYQEIVDQSLIPDDRLEQFRHDYMQAYQSVRGQRPDV
jgi:hypothetical protein